MNKLDVVEIAKKKRHIFLLEKLKKKTLTAAETRELEKYQTMAKGKPKILTGQKAAAKHCRVSDRTIRKWISEGMPMTRDGKYNIDVLDQWKKKKKQARKKKKPEVLSENEKQRRIMSKKRAAERDITIPPIKNKRRRNRCKNNPQLFCQTYFPHIFYNEFTSEQLDIINDIVERIKNGGLQAVAATRGDGKTSIARVVAGIWGICYGHLKWLVLLGANSSDAELALEDIKYSYENNVLLGEDFPEIITPIRELKGSPQKARSQTAHGEQTRFRWGEKRVIFPHVKGSNASGSIITVRGVDSPIRGLVRQGRRPDLILPDDVETRESVKSQVMTENIKETIEKDVLGLAGPGETMAVLWLCTILRFGCLSDQLTDRKLNPAWNGRRYKFLLKEPTHKEMWDKYAELRQKDQLDGDKYGRTAHAFYLKNKKKMNEGAEVNNPYRFINKPLEEISGRKKNRRLTKMDFQEVSAIQHAYNIIADNGMDFFDTEHQNSPKQDATEVTALDTTSIQKKLNGKTRGIIPKDAIAVTSAIDLRRTELHWQTIAWMSGAIGHVVDYGIEQIHAPLGDMYKDKVVNRAMEEAILQALLQWRNDIQETGYAIEDSDLTKEPDLVFIDSAWMPNPVARFCRSSSTGIYKPCKGLGTKPKQGAFKRPKKAPGGSHWYKVKDAKRKVIVYNLDADYYKRRVHDGFLTSAGQKGSLSVFGDDPIRHRTFAGQILAEVWVSSFVPGKGMVEGWDQRRFHNHFLDTSGYNIAAAEVLDISLISENDLSRAKKKKIKLSELQAQKRGR